MFTTTEWSEALADAASELLEKSHLLAPPVDAIGIARSLGMQVAWDHGQSGRGRIKRIAGKSIIFLRPDDRPERLHCHRALKTSQLGADENQPF